MKTHIFHLQVVRTGDILPHEEYDVKRAKPLIDRFKDEKFLSNPILVASLDKDKYLQLDGMNRLSVFKIMKIPSILTQIIDYNDQESVELSSWIHLFHTDAGKFLDYLRNMGLAVRQGRMDEVGHRYVKEEGMGRICTVVTREKEVYLVSSNGNLYDKVITLNKIVAFYKNKIIRDVLPVDVSRSDIDVLFNSHTDTNILIVFPTFTRHQIIDVVRKGLIFPAGITRHIIRRRCLNVRIPIDFFRQEKSVDELNSELETMLLKRPFRVYEEPTVYFE